MRSVVDAADDLPKFHNFPQSFGGDGRLFKNERECLDLWIL